MMDEAERSERPVGESLPPHLHRGFAPGGKVGRKSLGNFSRGFLGARTRSPKGQNSAQGSLRVAQSYSVAQVNKAAAAQV